MRFALTFAIGIVFGLGITISGMANPAKVVNFFDITGTWDPSLMFVMGGALVVTLIGYRLVFRQSHPLLGHTFHLPSRNDIDLRLVGGAATFGIGWGIAGFCPGGALPVVGVGGTDVLIFVAAMIGGIYAARFASHMASGPHAPVPKGGNA